VKEERRALEEQRKAIVELRGEGDEDKRFQLV
jgi:hypothetical protein